MSLGSEVACESVSCRRLAEAWSDLLLDLGVKYQLFSYFHFRSALRKNGLAVQETFARLRRAKAKGYRFMLDSGAFTYRQKSETGGVPPPAPYFEEYLHFCIDYADVFDVFCELDIDDSVIDHTTGKLVPTWQVDEWTDRMIDALGPKVMPVYHANRGDKWLLEWLADTRSPLIGLASDITVDNGLGLLIAKCHQWGKFTHGFAQTRIKTDLKYSPFDSIDSTTWLRADRFGGTMIFRNSKLIVLDHLHKADRRIYKSWYEQWGLDFKKVALDDLYENRKATIVTWRELANHFESQWFFRTGGKYPYLYQMYLDKKPIPKEHPLVSYTRDQQRKR